MCGIVGIMNAAGRPVSAIDLQRMRDVIQHRGPDDGAHFTHGGVGLAHRRLSIIDLSTAGRQPISSPDGRFIMIYNGEVYNFQELRVQLSGLGHVFTTRTDSEVVLHAIAQWGPDAIRRFNGMFALAVYDLTTGELLLARDRYGIKPLYYSLSESRLIFASEVKAILAAPKSAAAMDQEGLMEYLTFQNFYSDRTLFADIRMLPAGSFIRIRPDRLATAAPERYWNYRFGAAAHQISSADYVEELDRLLRQSVNRQVVSDVPVGSYLSGGLDSGTLTSLAARQLPYINTFTVGFDLGSASGVELHFDERQVAEHMSSVFRTEHYEMVLKSGDMERCMRELVWHLEEPRVGQSYPNYYAAKLASKFVTVVLSGTGGDEIFAGYPWRYYHALDYQKTGSFDKYYEAWNRLLPLGMLPKVAAPIWDNVRHVDPRSIMDKILDECGDDHDRSPSAIVNRALHFEARTFLHGLLVVEDKLSMAHSLESRVPFLDNDLVDFAMSVPVDLKLADLHLLAQAEEQAAQRHFESTRNGKLILRQAIERHVPSSVSQGRKQGFSAPDSTWFRGESIDYVRDRLLNPTAAIYDYLDFEAVSGLIQDHVEGRTNRRLLIWSMLHLEEWCRIFLRSDPTRR